VLQRARRTAPVRVLKAYGGAHAGNYAAGVAFQGFLSMFPLILGMLALTGVVFRDPGMRSQVESAITSVFPGDARPQITQALQGVNRSAGILGIISVLGLIWSGSSLFGTVEFALTQVFGTRQRDTVRQRAMGVVMMLVFVAALLVAVAANSVAAATPLGLAPGLVLGAAVLVLLLAAIYRFVPNRTFSLRQVLPGAIVAGVAVELFTLLFPLYAKVMHGFNSYGQQFALFFLLATWMLFLAQFLLLGAVVIRMREGEPQQEGLVDAPEDKAREAPRPVDAVREQSDDPRERELAGTRDREAESSRRSTP
jgi:membrane protein